MQKGELYLVHDKERKMYIQQDFKELKELLYRLKKELDYEKIYKL